MNEAVRALEPMAVWNNFADLNAVPRASKKETHIIAFMKLFAMNLKLPVHQDHVGNLIIKKPATPGYEDRATVCLQGHLDMVHQKNAATIFDFDTQGIEMYVEGDWVRANGTTLGADNGMGVASIMTLLAATDIEHPRLEALFTVDEETGMTGALGLKGGLLDAEIMLNLDTEEDNELTIGCAGGIDVTGTGKYRAVVPKGVAFKISIKGLKGGHSGIDIHRGRANANKLMNRILLYMESLETGSIATIEGGSLRNAIPRESVAVVMVARSKAKTFKAIMEKQFPAIIHEYKYTDPNMSISIEPCEMPEKMMQPDFQHTFLRVVGAITSGIYRMDSNIEGLVQTSNNLSKISVANGVYSIQNLTRSSLDSEKMDLANTIKNVIELLPKSKIAFGSSYTGWTPNPDAKIVKIMVDLYQKLHNGEKPLVNACHAGLECGILGTNYPNMEMISFGPTIHGAHSPDETVCISSVQKFWHYLLETLKATPLKAA